MEQIKKLFLSDKFILALIIINALLIFVQEFDFAPTWINYLDFLFTILFTFELFVKISTYGFKRYWSRGWNKTDLIIVVAAWLSVFQFILSKDYESLSFILSFRAIRIFKSFRLIRFVPNVAEIIAGVKKAIKASYIVVIAFVILLFIVSTLTCALFKNIAPEYFETPITSLYAIFRLFTIEGWYEIPDLIASRVQSSCVGFFVKLYFVTFLFVGGILGLSIINSIFVDAMVSDNNDELNKKVDDLSKKIDILISNQKPDESKN